MFSLNPLSSRFIMILFFVSIISSQASPLCSINLTLQDSPQLNRKLSKQVQCSKKKRKERKTQRYIWSSICILTIKYWHDWWYKKTVDSCRRFEFPVMLFAILSTRMHLVNEIIKSSQKYVYSKLKASDKDVLTYLILCL